MMREGDVWKDEHEDHRGSPKSKNLERKSSDLILKKKVTWRSAFMIWPAVAGRERYPIEERTLTYTA